MATPVHAFWCRTPSRGNFGDALTPWLIRRVTGRLPRFAQPGDGVPKHLVTGSVIEYADGASTVWGAGLMRAGDRVHAGARIAAVRGPLTRARALDCGADCPEVYGDPALLLPRFHRPRPGPRFRLGVLPHYADKPRVVARWRAVPGTRLIDVQAPVETVLDAIAGCEALASSSLHGLIAAHAYGVPAVRVSFGELPSGDGTKFADHYLALGLEPPAPVVVDPAAIDPGELLRRASVTKVTADLDRLWAACPFA
jgi:hypothetical protein